MYIIMDSQSGGMYISDELTLEDKVKFHNMIDSAYEDGKAPIKLNSDNKLDLLNVLKKEQNAKDNL